MAGKSPASADDIMSPQEMKQLFAKAKRGDPINCAIALSKDKQGLILLDKKKKPRKLSVELKKAALAAGLEIETTTLRFGRAEVDTDIDAALVNFVVNKEAPGTLRPKLLERVRKAGFGKVALSVDESIEAEPEDEEVGAAGAGVAAVAPTSEAPPDAVAPAAGGGGIAEIQHALADLIRQVQQAVMQAPERKAELLGLASAATAAVKAGVEAAAQEAVEALRRALGVQGSGGDAGLPAMLAALGKSSQVWEATLKHVEKQVETLQEQMVAAYKGHGFAADLEKVFKSKVEPMLESLDAKLIGKIAEVSGAADAAARARLVAEAQQLIVGYESYLAGEPLIAKLDANPFVPLTIGKTLKASLDTLSRSLGSVAGKMAA